MFKISLDNNAKKDLDKIDFQVVKKIFGRIKALEIEPRPYGSIKLKGENAYRIRLGNYRILYVIEEEKRKLPFTVLLTENVYR